MGEHQDPGVHFVMVEEKRNILIGYAVRLLYVVHTQYLITLLPTHT